MRFGEDILVVHSTGKTSSPPPLPADLIPAGPDIIWETDADLRMVSRRRMGSANSDGELADCGDGFLGKSPLEFVRADSANEQALRVHWKDLLGRQPFRGFVHRLVKPDGAAVWLEVNGDPFFGADGEFLGYRGITRDITNRVSNDARIAFIAEHDALTGLPNRTLFLQRLRRALDDLKPGRLLATMILDLDNFKIVNDAMGHAVGDDLLRIVGERLSGCIRHTDTVARVGGDEFAIVQVDMEHPEEAALFAERVAAAIRQPCGIGEHRLIPGATIGIALALSNDVSADRLLRHADIAQCKAKVEAPGTWLFFEPEMAARVLERRALESELHAALANGEFELYYQPFYNIVAQNTCAFEALLRWRHPTRGIMLPDQFVPLAEETGLIVPIGEWILMEACKEAAKWPDHVSVSINLSPVQFRSTSPVHAVKNALNTSGLPASRLELEITETVMLQDSESCLAALHQLRELGCRISMDDFGIGYSSLSYLRSFPFDKIKIDRSFIRDLNRTPEGTAIVRAIATLGSSLQLATTAEGVETKEQFSIVRAEGCTEVQGYLFSEPRPARDIPDLLEAIPDEIAFPFPELHTSAKASPKRLLVDVPPDGNVLDSEAV